MKIQHLLSILAISLVSVVVTGCAADGEPEDETGQSEDAYTSRVTKVPAPSHHPRSAGDPQPSECNNQCTFVPGDPNCSPGSPSCNNRWLLPG